MAGIGPDHFILFELKKPWHETVHLKKKSLTNAWPRLISYDMKFIERLKRILGGQGLDNLAFGSAKLPAMSLLNYSVQIFTM